VRIAVRRILQKSGYKVIVAASGAEALTELAAHGGQIELVLTDMVMPGIGGRELVERINQSYPAMRTVCMSGYTEDATLRLGQLAGEQAFIAKPFTIAELTATIRRVLDTAAAEQAIALPLAAISGAGDAKG
jgi:CheY-like chemotaxis protein